MLNTLTATRAARLAAEAAHKAAEEAVTRARANVELAQRALTELSAEEADWLARHAKRLVARARDGVAGPAPAAVATDKSYLARRTAEATCQAAQQALAELETYERAARSALTDAQSREQELIAQLCRGEVDRIANRILALRVEEMRLCAVLVASDELSSGAWLTAEAQEAINSPPARPSGELILGGRVLVDIHSPRGGHQTELAAGREFWAQFAARLNSESTETAAACAA